MKGDERRRTTSEGFYPLTGESPPADGLYCEIFRLQAASSMGIQPSASVLLTCAKDSLSECYGQKRHSKSDLLAIFQFPCAGNAQTLFDFSRRHTRTHACTHAQKTQKQTSTLSPSHSGHCHRRCLRPHTSRYAIYFCKELSHYFCTEADEAAAHVHKAATEHFPFRLLGLDFTRCSTLEEL